MIIALISTIQGVYIVQDDNIKVQYNFDKLKNKVLFSVNIPNIKFFVQKEKNWGFQLKLSEKLSF